MALLWNTKTKLTGGFSELYYRHLAKDLEQMIMGVGWEGKGIGLTYTTMHFESHIVSWIEDNDLRKHFYKGGLIWERLHISSGRLFFDIYYFKSTYLMQAIREEVYNVYPGKKLWKQLWRLLFNLACMKIALFNLFCIEPYANFLLTLLWLSGALFGISGTNSPWAPYIFFTVSIWEMSGRCVNSILELKQHLVLKLSV